MIEPDLQAVVELARKTPGLDLLLLFGSRARGESHPGSDWDFGYLAGPELDPYDLLALLALLMGTDRIDLVNLNRTNGLLRFRVAAEGKTLFESSDGVFESFAFGAISYWCDMGPIIRAGYEEILRDLARP
ncbi:MAG TPA: nucleotidyltransferase domain-containing protein [Thermoanaerobaculia bacterium]|jgi:predicted nucleotidyltransferase